MRRTTINLVLAGLLVAATGAASPASQVRQVGPAHQFKRKPPGRFKLVGHDPLLNRGMNAALAIHGNYAYVGSRTDGSHPNAGVLVVDISNPSDPEVVNQIGPPYEGNPGETSRELRVWPEKDLLIVMNLGSNCSPAIHACSPTSFVEQDNFRFYDISGAKAAAPEFVAEYVPSQDPHEFYLWDDPKRRGRALFFMSTPGDDKQMLITDISRARKGKFKELGSWTTFIPDDDADRRLHSLSISNNGRRAYLAYLGGGFFIVDTSDFARGVRNPQVRQVTPINNRVHWGNPGVHSAIRLFRRPFVMTTDEVYGQLGGVLADHGCPWGWARFVNIRNPKKPRVVSHYKIRANRKKFCKSEEKNPPDRHNNSSWSAHNPTVTRKVAFVSWHSGGLQAISLKRPARPRQLAKFRPKPLPFVTTEDPALSSGRDKVVVWSFPIIQDGIVWVVDIRNGLYALRYKGPAARHVRNVDFIEGNSNLGDHRRFARS